MECSICNRIVPRFRTENHFFFNHKTLPPSAMRYTEAKCAKFFIKCLVCHKIISGSVLSKIEHRQKYHSELPPFALFKDKKLFLQNAVKCDLCNNFVPVRLFDTHLKEEHPGEQNKQTNVHNGPNPNIANGTAKSDQEQTSNGNLKPEDTKVDDAESEEQIFVRCDYCGKELLPNFIDDHILQEHVTDVEDNDEDDNDDSVSLSSRGNQNSEAKQTLNDSKASIVTRVDCEYCSKKVRLDKIEKHNRKKHSKETETKNKLKRKKSESGSVEIVAANKSRKVSESVSLNGDEHKEGQGEEEFYTIYVSKNELEKFLLAKRVFPKNGMFHLKDSV